MYIILALLFFMLLYRKSSSDKTHIPVQNDGTVNFCDVKTFEDNILTNVPKVPLPGFISMHANVNVSHEMVSKVSQNIIHQLNKVSNSCFHLLNLHSLKTQFISKFTVIEVDIQVYSQIKNYNMTLNVVSYVDEMQNIFIHSMHMVTPVPIEDKWSQDQKFEYKKLLLQDESGIEPFVSFPQSFQYT